MTVAICDAYNKELKALRRENRLMFAACFLLLGIKAANALLF